MKTAHMQIVLEGKKHTMFTTASEILNIVKICEELYGDKRDAIKKIYREKLIKHQKENNTKNLLASAIALSKDTIETKEVILYIGASV